MKVYDDISKKNHSLPPPRLLSPLPLPLSLPPSIHSPRSLSLLSLSTSSSLSRRSLSLPFLPRFLHHPLTLFPSPSPPSQLANDQRDREAQPSRMREV